MKTEFPKTEAVLATEADGREAAHGAAKPAATIYDDLLFNGDSVRSEAPPPIECRESPFQFSMLQLMMLVTVVAMFFSLANLLGGIRYAVIIAFCLAQIVLHLYLRCMAPPYDRWEK